jgi:hypothetical protein
MATRASENDLIPGPYSAGAQRGRGAQSARRGGAARS